MTDALEAAAAAHRAALAAQETMREQAQERDEAVRAAIAAGHSTKEIAGALGVIQRRVQAMATTAANNTTTGGKK